MKNVDLQKIEVNDPFIKLSQDIESLCPVLRMQMEIVDLDETSYLKDLIKTLKSLDSKEIAQNITHNSKEFLEIIQTLNVKKEIDTKDGFIFTKRAVKEEVIDPETKARRMSFANTKFANSNLILKIEDLREMTNLNYIFSMNGYHLPFCESSNQRAMYEHFFSEFLKEYDNDFPLSNRYQLLLESVMTIYIITEMLVDVLEAIFEIIDIIGIRIKSCSALLDVANVNRFNDVKNDLLMYLIVEFRNNNRAYKLFCTKKLLKIVSSRDDITASWTEKVSSYIENIQQTLEKQRAICDVFTQKMQELKRENYIEKRIEVKPKRSSTPVTRARSSSRILSSSPSYNNVGIQMKRRDSFTQSARSPPHLKLDLSKIIGTPESSKEKEEDIDVEFSPPKNKQSDIALDEKCKKFCSDITIYIQTYENFINENIKPKSKLNKMLQSCLNVLEYMDQVEDSLSSFKSPRSRPRKKSSTGEVEESPRGSTKSLLRLFGLKKSK